MTSLKNIPLPAVDEEANLLGWDETIGNRSLSTVFRHWERPSLCRHAMAHGSFVFGSGDKDNTSIAWKTEFRPQRICRVASNADGSIVVASTNFGNVSLLRGRDGKVIATRKVHKSPEDHVRPPEVSFVSGASSSENDALVIMVPTSDIVATGEDAQSVNVILVSNICGEQLNNENMEHVADAAKQMSIDALEFDPSHSDLESLQACRLNSSTIRFAAGQVNGQVSIHDYDMTMKQMNVVKSKIEDWTFLTTIGMKLHEFGTENTFLVLCGTCRETTNLCWYDLVRLTMACNYQLEEKNPRVLALEPLHSFSDDSALALAVAVKDSASDCGFIDVVQIVAEETMGLAVLVRPHRVYHVPVAADQSLMLQGIDIVSLQRPYSFRFRAAFGSGHSMCSDFCTQDGGVVGQIRFLLQCEMYDQADELLVSNSSAMDDSFGAFHSSEVALRRLQSLLSNGSLGSEETMECAQEYIQRLVAGAISNSETGQKHLIEATDCVLSWPSRNKDQTPSIAEFSMALSTISKAIETALRATNAERESQLENKKKEAEDRLAAMRCIEALVESESSQIQLVGSPFLGATSPSDVFGVLMEEGFFSVAEKLWRSEWGRDLSAEALASSILSISATQDPRTYSTLLTEAVLPKLSITHEAIPLIRTWACLRADEFDERDDAGLEPAIFLLQTVLTSIQQLNLRVHSSFASYCPFTETRKARQPSPRNGVSSDTSVSSFSSDRDQRHPKKAVSSLQPSYQPPAPTVLELGFLKGGAMKSTLRSFSKRRSGEAASLINDTIDDTEECVEIKLRHARILQEARKLGLSRSAVTLRQYLRLGETEHVAKELVRILSSSAADHDERYLALTSKVKPFCDRASVDFDQVLVNYNGELCGSKYTSTKALVETSSIARCCCKPVVRCEIALAVLRVALLFDQTAPPSLMQLSRDAIEWAAVDASVKSELEEATRLLVVDGIVRKYCGPGARELFRVDNPLHATRLLDFVSRHFRTPSVLSDVLDLCDAFTFVTREESCVLVLQRAASAGDVDLCVQLLTEIFRRTELISANVARRVLDYCALALEETSTTMSNRSSGLQSNTRKEKAISACRVMCAVAEACHVHFGERVDHEMELIGSSFGTILRDCKRVQRLQAHHDIFLPLRVFESLDATVEAARLILSPIVQEFVNGDVADTETLILSAKSACSILFISSERDAKSIWYTVAGEAASYVASSTADEKCMEFLAAAGILDDFGDDDAVQALLSVALALCHRASFDAIESPSDTLRCMKDVIQASSIVHDYALVSCPERMLVALVSLAVLTETARQVLLRADEGFGDALETLSEKLTREARSRRYHLVSCESHVESSDVQTVSIGRPLLHPSWYVGDGLLLPPRDALHASVAYCKDVLDICLKSGDSIASMGGPADLHRFLGERGAHSAALRVVCVCLSMALSADRLPTTSDGSTIGTGFLRNLRDALKNLGERSLGGSGTGITSVTIDSELAVTFILSLPIKVAFKVYQASLPTAIAKRDFSRVITLANIGVRAGNGDTGWSTQQTFLTQCQRLSTRAGWWNVLQHYQVDFDPSRFDDNDSLKEDEGAQNTSAYAASLISELIDKLSLAHKCVKVVRVIVTRFVTAFGLEAILAAQKHIEYVLSPPPVAETDFNTPDDVQRHHSDIRWDLSLCERAARESLRLIQSPMKRSAVLRRCVTALESNTAYDKDYERHAMVLALYHADLSLAVARDSTIREKDATAFEEELEHIERRRDALAILSSFFHGEKKMYRPPFPKFFISLPVPFRMERNNANITACDVLGVALGNKTDSFDPLGPLQDFISLHMDDAAAKALAPLTIPLGLPNGSIHARCLVERFHRYRGAKDTLPAFDHDVLPVLNRLKLSSDQYRLAEWCSDFYDNLDPQKLSCLDYALQCAMKFSSEVENRMRRRTKGDEALLADERRALDAVKRHSDMHSVLSDRVEVNRILRSAEIGSPQQFRSVEAMVLDLTDRLEKSLWVSSESSPEKFVEMLLVEASLLASNACLNSDVSFSICQFRHMASVVHQACKRIAEQYSHVHPGRISRRLARRWLVHGDEMSAGRIESCKSPRDTIVGKTTNIDQSLSVSAEDDDTVNFVMDLNSLGEHQVVWSDDIGSSLSKEADKSARVSKEEEPSALEPNGSSREASELDCSKVALRVAFVMSYAEGYHKIETTESGDEENVSLKANTTGKSKGGPKKSRPGLLSRISTKDSDTRAFVMEHAKELMGIVFASKSDVSEVGQSVTFLSAGTSDEDNSDGKALTFAMRYRAFRAAAVLCPQIALENVVAEKGYLSSNIGEVECNLHKCTYGAFVAKEIEEMGLPLPHSDLVQLSTMHFPSYARALWRHHRDGDMRGKTKGRLLVLLLEMSLKDNSDSELAAFVLNEMSRLRLPRSLLLGCECVARYKSHMGVTIFSSLLRDDNTAVSNALNTLTNLVLSEVHQVRSSKAYGLQQLSVGLGTVQRCCSLVQTFSDTETGQRQLSQFANVLVDLVALGNDSFSVSLATVALNATHSLISASSRTGIFVLLGRQPSGQVAIHSMGQASHPMSDKEVSQVDDCQQSLLMTFFDRLEASYHPLVLMSSQ